MQAKSTQQSTLDEQALLSHMQKTMRLNIKAQCYTDAIFYADKIVNMLRSRECPASNSSPATDKVSN